MSGWVSVKDDEGKAYLVNSDALHWIVSATKSPDESSIIMTIEDSEGVRRTVLGSRAKDEVEA